jgi:hypothetical protein
MSLRGKVPPGLLWLGILIAVALLMSVILGFRIDKRLWGELRIDRIALSNPPADKVRPIASPVRHSYQVGVGGN